MMPKRMTMKLLLWMAGGFVSSVSCIHRRSIPSPQDFLVQGLAEIEPAFAPFQGSMYAGLIPTKLYGDEQDGGELMFWLFAPDQPTYDDTLLVWNNGGPGCSSMSGALFENSPVTIHRYPAGFYGIDPAVPLEYNPYAWTNATWMMFVEHPHGAGFSKGEFPHNETEVARDFYYFLQNLFDIFGSSEEEEEEEGFGGSSGSGGGGRLNLRSKKLNFFGESYAGFYVPSIAYYIHQENKRGHYPPMNLHGIGLGNGWIDAKVQGPAVIDYAWWHGMIDSSTVKAMKQEWENCKDGSGDQPEPFHAFTTPDECNIMGGVMQAAGVGVVDWGGPNAYDVTTWDPYLMLDAPEGSISQFYNNPAVQDALNVVPHTHWVACMPGAGRRRRRRKLSGKKEEDLLPGQILLRHDEPLTMAPYIATLLDEAGIRVLIYNGDRDLTTNAQGSERVLDNMLWSGAKGWADTRRFERGMWFPSEKKFGGYIKSFRNLEFLIVANSGHLVPFNQDKLALDLITRFLGGASYLDKSLPKFKISPKKSSTASTELQDLFDEQMSRRGRAMVFGLGGTIMIALASFAIGFAISRRIPRGRDGYEMV